MIQKQYGEFRKVEKHKKRLDKLTMITVCMATFNGEKYIEEQIISILSQLNDYDELIISDDGSTDSTVEIIKKIDDKRINLVFNKNDRGYSSNFYNAMSMATGDYIFYQIKMIYG
ncbi:glycosyltransferase [Streptococcus iniae]